VSAVVDAYPNIGLDQSKFILTPSMIALSEVITCVSKTDSFIKTETYWLAPNNHKIFFDNFAKARGFDPLKAHNWYSVSKDDIKTRMVCPVYILFRFYVVPPVSFDFFFRFLCLF
jgi:hypothetical protein